MNSASDQIPPHDLEAERAALGACLLDDEARADVLRILRPADFYRIGHQEIAAAIVALHDRGVRPDVVLLRDELVRTKRLDAAGGEEVLHELATVPTAANAEHYARIVRDRAGFREAASRHRRGYQAAMSPNGVSFAEYANTEANDFRDLAERATDTEAGPGGRRLPAPLGILDLLEVEEPEHDWLFEGLISAGGNVLCAAYPKSFKTMFLLLVAVCLAAGKPLFGMFPAPVRRRSGLILMEDQAHRIRHRLARLCQGLGIALRDLDGWLHLWFRPKIQLLDKPLMAELGAYARDLDLDLLAIDSWSYVAEGDSNSSDDVGPQLQAFGDLRDHRPGLTTWLTHHAKKTAGQDTSELRIADIVRNSIHFSAWYETGVLLERKAEDSNLVTIRTDLRDGAPPPALAVDVLDEFPADPPERPRSSGWLRMSAVAGDALTAVRNEAGKRLAPTVLDFIRENPGCSKRAVRGGVKGGNSDIDSALAHLKTSGEITVYEPVQKGKGAQYFPAGEEPK